MGVMAKFNTILPTQVVEEMDRRITEWKPSPESELATQGGQFPLTSGAIRSLV